MSIIRKFNRKEKKTTKKGFWNESLLKVSSTLLALGSALLPNGQVEAASDIKGIGSSAPVIDNKTGNNAYNIYPTKVKDALAINTFDTFKVGSGDIANLHFKPQTGSDEANKLINFVNNRININGTLNAIHNNKIGGDVYFLSKNGMTVGASGVINAGSLTVMTPTAKWWDSYANNVTVDNIKNDTITNITNMTVPINASGTIVVKGSINAADSVRLKSAAVAVGSEVDLTDKHKASIKTGVEDFSKLVGLTDEQKNDAGLTAADALKLTQTGDGRILLAAENSYNDNKTGVSFASEVVNATVSVVGGSQIIAKDNRVDSTTKNNVVEISAVATNNMGIKKYTKTENGKENTYYEVNGTELSKDEFADIYGDDATNSAWHMDVTTNAKIIINGDDKDNKTSITGERLDINAESSNKYATNDNGLFSSEKFTKLTTSVLLNGWDASVGLLENNAIVDIGANTLLIAEGQDTTDKKAMSIKAKADSELDLGASSFGLNLLSGKWSNLSMLPGVAVNYGVANNKAEIKIAGELQAKKGTTDIYADADSKLHSTATTALILGAAPVDGFVNLAFNDVKGANNSKIDITNTAVMTKLGNDVNLKAYSNSDVYVSTNMAMGDKGLACAGLTFVDFKADSSINVDTTIKANHKIDVDSKSVFDNNEITTAASAGKGFLWGMISSGLVSSHAVNQTLDKINYNLGDSIKQISQGTNLGSALEDLANMAKIGVAYNSVDEGSHATVSLGSSGKLLTSLNDTNVAITAESIIHKNHVYTLGTSSNSKPTSGDQTASLLANGAIQIVKLDSSADIILEGNTEDKLTSPKIKAKDVFLKTKSESVYDRVDTLMKKLYGELDDRESVLDDIGNPGVLKIYQDYKERVSELYKVKDGSLTDEFKDEYQDPIALIRKLNEILQTEEAQRYYDILDGKTVHYKTADGVDAVAQLNEEQSKQLEKKDVSWFGQAIAAFSFVSPENYMTYHAGSSTSSQKDTPEDKQKASKLAAAVAVDYTSVNHRSNVLVGKDVVIAATNDIKVESTNASGDVTMDGKLGLNGGGKVFSAGANVGIHKLDATSIIAVAENAKLKAAGELELDSKNKLLHVAINPGIGMSDNAQITGNLDFTYTNSDNIIFVDDEASLWGKKLTLNSVNDTTLVNITGGLAMSGTASIGVAWSFNEINRNNLVILGDNDAVATMDEDKPKFPSERLDDEGKEVVYNSDDAETRAKKLLAYNLKADKYNKGELFGSASNVIKDASINAHQMSVDATTDGAIDIITADVGIVMNGDSDKPGVGDKLNNLKSNLSNRITNKLKKLDDKIAGRLGQLPMNNWESLPVDQKAVSSSSGKTLPSFTLNAAGSVGIAEMDAMTAAVVDSAKIRLVDDAAASKDADKKNTLSVNAYDDSSLVNVSGGVGFDMHGINSQAEGFSATSMQLTGGVAYNDVKSDVVAVIKDSSIANADVISNNAEREGALTSASAAIGLQFNSGTQAPKGVGLTGGVSVNLGDYSTLAQLGNNKINTEAGYLTGENRTTEVVNNALTKDLQVTGALDLEVVKAEGRSIGIGMAVTRGYLQNTVLAELDGGEYRKLNNLANTAVTDLTQVGAVVGGGVSIGQQGSKGANVAVQGAMVFNDVENFVNSNVKNAIIDAIGLDVRAYDTQLGDGPNKYAQAIAEKYNLDTTGQKYINAAKTDANNESIEEHGGVIVGAAVQFLGAEGSSQSAGVGIGGSVVNNYLNNNYGALVDGVTLNADIKTANSAVDADVNVLAESSNLAVAVAAGVAVIEGDKAFEATGSISVNNVEGGVTSKVNNSDFNAANTSINALNKDKFVNVAGGITLSSKSAGISYAMNKMSTTTGAYLYDTQIKHEAGAAVAVNASNTAKFTAVGAGVGGSNIGINGSLGINFGTNNVEAIADGKKKVTQAKKLNNITDLTVTSNDSSRLTAVAGGFYLVSSDPSKMFSGAAIGGAFAWNELGHDKQQHNKAELNNYVISTQAKPESTDTSKDRSAKVEVEATDDASIYTVGAGVAIVAGKDAKGAIEGAGVYAKLHKDTEAVASNLELDKKAANSKADADTNGAAKVKVSANEGNSITDVAAVLDLGKGWTVIGGAASVTDTETQTKAHVENSTINADNILVDAKGKNEVLSIAAGAAGSSSYVNAAGSVNVNSLADTVSAYINGGTYTANNNIGITADGQEIVQAGSGALSVNVSLDKTLAASLGLSLIKNDFNNNNVYAYAKDANLTALGKAKDSYKKDVAALNTHNYTTDADGKFTTVTKDGKKYLDFEASRGLVVDAYGKQDVTNVAATLGAEVSTGGTMTASLAGALAISEMGGNTFAYLESTDVNKNAETPGDVTVTAFNEEVVDDVVANGSVGLNFSTGGDDAFQGNLVFGFAAAKEVLNRTISADIVGNATKKNTVNADKLVVNAGADNEVDMTTVGVGVNATISGGPSASLAINANANDNLIYSTNTVSASISNVESNNTGIDLQAAHAEEVDLDSVGVVVTANFSLDPTSIVTRISGDALVNYSGVYETNTVSTSLNNATITHEAQADNNANATVDDFIRSTNYSDHDLGAVSVSVNATVLGVGVAVDCVNETMTDTLHTSISNSSITGADSVTAESDNKYKVDSHTVGVNLSVVNVGISQHFLDVNSSSSLELDNATLDADTITLANNENRSLTLEKENALPIAAVSVAYTKNYVTMNEALKDSLESVSKEEKENKQSYLDEYKDLSSKFNKGVGGYYEQTGTLTGNQAKGVNLNGNDGSGVTPQGMQTSVEDSTLTATTLSANNTITNDIDIYSGSGSGSVIGVGKNRALVDEYILNALNISGSTITADTVNIGSTKNGTTFAHGGMGFFTVIGSNTSWSKILSMGENSIGITDNTTINNKNLNITVLDNATNKSQVKGGGFMGIGGGGIEIEATDKLDNSILIDGSTLQNTGDTDANNNTGKMSITADKSSLARSYLNYGTVNVAGGCSYWLDSVLDSDNIITIQNSKIYEAAHKANTKGAGALDVYAHYGAKTEVESSSGSGSVVGGGSGTYSTSSNTGSAMIVAHDNSFDITAVKAKSLVGGTKTKSDGTTEVDVLADANIETTDITIAVNGSVNKTWATLDTVANVDFTNNTFSEKKEKVVTDYKFEKYIDSKDKQEKYRVVPVYSTVKTGKTNLQLDAETSAKSNSYMRGISAGVIAVGANLSYANVTEKTMAKLVNNSSAKTELNKLAVSARGNDNVYNLADGRGGGIIAVSPYAAYAENHINTNADVLVKGNYTVKDNADIIANQQDDVETKAFTEGGSVAIEAASIEVINELKGGSSVTISDSTINAANANIQAQDIVNFNKEFDFATWGRTGAVAASGGSSWLTNTVDKTAKVDINKSAITVDTDLHVDAITLDNIIAKAKLATGSVVVSAAKVEVKKNDITINDEINVKNSNLKNKSNKGEITLTAADDSNIYAGAFGHVGTLVGSYVDASLDHNMTRKNTINITRDKASADYDIYSNSNVKLYAGDFADGRIGGLFSRIEAQGYEAGIIPVGQITYAIDEDYNNVLNSKLTMDNQVIIGANTKVASIGDTNIYADDGAVDHKTISLKQSWYPDDGAKTSSYSTVQNTDNNANVDLKSKISVLGSVLAGQDGEVVLAIGKQGELVILDKANREAAQKSGLKVLDTPTLNFTKGEDKLKVEDIKLYTANVGLSLYQQYLDMQDALSTYSDVDVNDPTYKNLKESYTQLRDRMVRMGLMTIIEEIKDGKRTGETMEVVNTSKIADVIELPEIAVSGGNINLTTRNLVSGGGSMTANGSPQVKIVNNTNMYLKLNDITVGEPGGKITYNKDNVLTGNNVAKANAEINNINKSVKNTSFKSITAAVGEGKPEIYIENTYVPQTYSITSGNKTATYTPYSAIELVKGHNITNKSGDVTIKNQTDLIINGNVNGRAITMISTRGDIVQNSTEGVLNVGADPMVQYAGDLASAIGENGAVHFADTTAGTKSNSYTVTHTSPNEKGKISGGNIYLSGITINVNGLIQSGYDNYGLNISVNDKVGDDSTKTVGQKIAELDKITTPLTDAEVLTDKYCIKKGGEKFNATKGYYEYEVSAYYNPTTKKIIIPDIESYSGNVYLTGDIISTGNGRIMAMDGSYDIDIRNNIDRDLQLGRMVTSNIAGRITINNTATKTLTEITKANVKTTDSSGKVTTVKRTDNYTYKPVTNSRYEWNSGTNTTTRLYKQYKSTEDTIFGWFDETYDHKASVTKTVVDDKDKDKVPYDHVYSSDMGNFYVYGVQSVLSNERSPISKTILDDGMYSTEYLYEWHTTTGTSQQYTASVKADNPIAISFMGKDSGKVDVLSYGSVDLNGYVGSMDKTATVKVNSTHGGINQGMSSIGSSDVTLMAVGAIKDIKITSNDSLKLIAKNTANTNTTYYSNGASSKNVGDNSISIDALVANKSDGTAGTVKLQGAVGRDTRLDSSNDNKSVAVKAVTITTNGNIVQEGSYAIVDATQITLNATEGAIGTDAKHVKVNTGDNPLGTNPQSASLNASAKEGIYLDETEGDLRIGTIHSRQGDVKLTAPGSLVDALPYNEDAYQGASDEELIAKWTSLGLFSTEKDLFILHDENKNPLTTTEVNPYPVYDMVQMKDNDGKPLYAVKNEQGLVSYTTEPNDTPAMVKEQRKDSAGNPLYYQYEMVGTTWDKDRMLYAIRDEIVNPQAGISASNKTPNIKGKNIELTVGTSAGLNSTGTWERNIATLGAGAQGLEDLKFLAKQDATNVQWNAVQPDGTRTGKVIVQQKLPIGVEQLEGGSLKVVAGNGNGKEVYIETRAVNKDSVNTMDLVLKGINTAGNVLLNNGYGGIYADSSANGTVITGKDLTINAGGLNSTNGRIGLINGEKLDPLKINITGNLRATSTSDMNIQQMSASNNLNVYSASSLGNITLQAVKSILGTGDGYVRLEKDGTVLKLISEEGSVGGPGEARLQVVNSNDENEDNLKRKIVVDASKGDVYLYGNQNPTYTNEPAGTLMVDVINAKADGIIDLDSYGSIDITSDKLQAATVGLTAAKNISIKSKDALNVNNFTVVAGQHVDAVTKENTKYGGDVAIYAPSINITEDNIIDAYSKGVQGGNITITASNTSLSNAASLNAEGNVKLQAASSVENTGEITARNITMTAGDAEHTANATLKNTAQLIAYGNIKLEAYGEDKTVDADGAVIAALTNTGELQLENDADLKAYSGSIDNSAGIGKIVADQYSRMPRNISFIAAKDIRNVAGAGNSKKITADFVEMNLTGNKGDVLNDMYLEANKGAILIEAKGNIINSGTIKSTNSLAEFKAGDTIYNTGNLESMLEASFKAGKYIYNSGMMTSDNDNVLLTAGAYIENFTASEGNAHGTIWAKRGSVAMNTTGTVEGADFYGVKNTSDIAAERYVIFGDYEKMSATGDYTQAQLVGDIDNTGNVAAGVLGEANGELILSNTSKGSVVMVATGKVDNDGNILAKKDVVLSSTTDSVQNGRLIVGGDRAGNIVSAQGEITISADKDLSNHAGFIHAAQGIEVNSAKGNVNNAANMIVQNGEITIVAANNMNNIGNMSVTSDGNILFESGNALNNTGSMTIGGNGNIAMHAKDITNAASGTMKLYGNGTITVESENTTSNQGKMDIDRSGKIQLLSKGDVINGKLDYTSLSDTASMSIGDSKVSGLTGEIIVETAGNFTNYVSRMDIYGDGNIKVATKGNFINGGKSILDAATNAIYVNGNGNIELISAKEFSNSGGIGITGDGNITMSSGKAMTNTGIMNVKGDGDIKVEAESLSNTGVLTSIAVGNKGNIDVKVLKDMTNTAAMKIGNVEKGTGFGNVTIEAGRLENKYITSNIVIGQDGDITVKTTNDILNTGNMQIGRNGNIALASGFEMGAAGITPNGDTYNKGSMTIGNKGNISVTAAEDIRNSGNFTINNAGNITMSSVEDMVNSGDMNIVNKGDITLETTGNGTIYNLKNADMMTGNGNVALRTTGDYGIWYYDAKHNVTYVNDNQEIVNAVNAKLKAMENAKADSNGMMSVSLNGRKYYLDGLIFNSGDIMAMQGNINLSSKEGDIYNFDDFNTVKTNTSGGTTNLYNGVLISTSDINLSTPKGYIFNEKDIVSEKNVTIEAAEGLSNFAYNIYAVENITLKATAGDIVNTAVLESLKGNVSLTAEQGSVTNGIAGAPTTGDIVALGGNVKLEAFGKDEHGVGFDVVNYGDIIATGQNPEHAEKSGNITLSSEYGNVENYDNFNTVAGSEAIKYTSTAKHVTEIVKPEDGSYNIATGSITLSAKEGSVWNDKHQLVALENVTLEAKTGMDSFGETIYAGKNINLIATDGNLVNKAKLTSVEGDVSLEAQNGTVVNMLSGDILALGGNVTMHAGQQAEADHSVYYVDTTNGKGTKVDLGLSEADAERVLVVTKVAMVGNKEYIVSDVPTDHSKQVINVAELTTEQKNSINTKVYYIDEHGNKQLLKNISYVDKDGNQITGANYIAGDVEVYRKGDVVNRGDVTALGKTEIKDGVQVMVEPGTISMISDHSNVTNFDNFVMVDGAASYTFDGRDVYNEGTALNTQKTYKLYIDKGDLKATGSIDLEAPQGYFYNDFNIVTEGDLTLKSKHDLVFGDNFSVAEVDGNLVVVSTEGKVIGKGQGIEAGGNIDLQGMAGVEASDDITAGGAVNVSSGAGSVELSGEITGGAEVAVNAKNDVTISGDVNSGAEVAVTAGNDALVSGDVDAEGSVAVDAGANATISGDVNSGAKVTVNANSIETDGKITAEKHIKLDAADGNLTIKRDIENKADGIELYAKDGVVNISQNVTAGGTGILSIYAELQEQKLSHELVDGVIARGELKSINGSVDVSAVNGNVYLNNVEADVMAAVGTNKGDIVLGEIAGGTVVLYNDSAANTVEAKKVVVGEHLAIQSAEPHIEKIEAAEGAKSITIDIVGAEGKVGGSIIVGDLNKPVDYNFGNLAVGTAKVYTGGNINIGNLYVASEETSELVAKERVAIDSMVVKNKVYASGYDYETSVYGTVPSYDDSKAIYYTNSYGRVKPGQLTLDVGNLFFNKNQQQQEQAVKTVIKQLAEHKGTVAPGTEKGMNLYIDGKHDQSSNGLLLHNDNYYFVHGQRLAADSLSRIITDYKADNSYAAYYVDRISTFERYNLYDLDEAVVVKHNEGFAPLTEKDLEEE